MADDDDKDDFADVKEELISSVVDDDDATDFAAATPDEADAVIL